MERDADATGPGAPVTHATILAGGKHLCAHTRTRGDTWQVVCLDGPSHTVGFDVRRFPRAWQSPPLVKLITANTEGGAEALGLLADGRAVYFGREPHAVPVHLPPTGAHGPVVEIERHKVMFSEPYLSHNNWDDYTVVRTRDGAVLGAFINTPDTLESPSPSWELLFAPSEEAHLPPVVVEIGLCAATRRGVMCVSPLNMRMGIDAPRRELLMEASDLVAVQRVGDRLCTLDRAGALRCAPWGDHLRPGMASPVAGAPAHVEAMRGSPSDLCVRAQGARWWCTSGPSADAPRYLSWAHPTALKPEPLLTGAVEVEMSAGGGCARWPEGGVRCWGRALRGGDYLRRGPTEIRGLRDVTQLAADSGRTCALARGAVWCWGFTRDLQGEDALDARPTRVPIEGTVRALAIHNANFAAVGASVVRWNGVTEGLARTLVNPPGEAAPIDALAAIAEGVCARRVDGHVTCWNEVYDPLTWQSRQVVRRVEALEGYEHFAVRRDAVCAWRTSRGGRCWGNDEVVPSAYAHARVRSARTRELELLPARVEGACAVYSDGERVCEPAVATTFPQPPTPPWAIAPTSEVGLSLRLAGAPCAIAPDGRVACIDTLRPAIVQTPTAGSFTHYFWSWMPGLRDVRAVVHASVPEEDELTHACALLGDGRVFCWGENHGGSLTADDADRAPRMLPLHR